MEISTIGLDLAKRIFQVHGVDETDKVIVRKTLGYETPAERFQACVATTD